MTVALITHGMLQEIKFQEVDRFIVIGGEATVSPELIEVSVSIDEHNVTIEGCDD